MVGEAGGGGRVTAAEMYFVKRGFRWRGRDGKVWLEVQCNPKWGDEKRLYDVLCLCDRCCKIKHVTDEERVARAGRFCALMIIEAVSDLFLMENTDREEKPPKSSAEPTFTEARILVAARNLAAKLQELHGEKRAEILAAMRDAYEWMFSDERSVFRAVYDGAVITRTSEDAPTVDLQRICDVEVCIPFLVAAEAAHLDVEWFRAKVRHFMIMAGLTPKMGKFTRRIAASRIARSEAKVDRWFRAAEKAKPASSVAAPETVAVTVAEPVVEPVVEPVMEPAVEQPVEVPVVRPVPKADVKTDSTTKVNQWFKALKETQHGSP